MNNEKSLNREDSIKKLKDVAQREVAFFCTFTAPYEQVSRPMTTQAVQDDGSLIFFVKDDQDIVDQIEENSQVNLLYRDGSTYMVVHGEARTFRNQSLIDEHYTPLANAWFDGKDDPSLIIIEVTPEDAHYWETANGKVVTLYKLAQAAITGESVDIGISRDLEL